MIEEESLEYMKLTVNESLLENHFPDLSSDSRFRRDLLKDRVKALDACCEVNSEMADVVIQHKSELAIAYPGLVALPKEIASPLPLETAIPPFKATFSLEFTFAELTGGIKRKK